jgi:hypothetical protein
MFPGCHHLSSLLMQAVHRARVGECKPGQTRRLSPESVSRTVTHAIDPKQGATIKVVKLFGSQVLEGFHPASWPGEHYPRIASCAFVTSLNESLVVEFPTEAGAGS